MAELTTALISAATKKALEYIDPIIKYTKNKFDSTNAEENIIDKITHLQNVKTIWQYDKSVSIFEFYYPTKFFINQEHVQVEVYQDFRSNKPIVIEGNVGQGKSIFLRYIALNEFTLNSKIPLFIECRSLKASIVMDSIYNLLMSYGFPNDDNIFFQLLNSEKFTLYLDGFDELSILDAETVIKQIEYFITQFPKTKVLITSRPDSGIQMSSYFDVLSISNILDLKGFITKIIDDEYDPKELIEKIEQSNSEIKSLLTSPLLITLLVFTYQVNQEIPKQFSEFYNDIFQILLNKHDNTKAGYKRERHSALNNIELQNVFETFCFLSKKNTELVFDYKQLNTYIEKALLIMELEADTTQVVNDILKITNLIIPIGMEYQFVHRSIQEYFTACFIKNRDEQGAIKAYQYILSNYAYDSYHKVWKQELLFLEEIDSFRYIKYVFLPHINKILLEFNIENIEMLTASDVLKKVKIYFKSGSYHHSRFVFSNNFIFEPMKTLISYKVETGLAMNMDMYEYVMTKFNDFEDFEINANEFEGEEARNEIYNLLSELVRSYYEKIRILELEKNISDELFEL